MPEGASVQYSRLTQLGNATACHAPDGTFVRTRGCVGMGLQAHHTHERSKLECEPASDQRANMVTFDGRIDNHVELSKILRLDSEAASDSHLVLAAFTRWGENCFSHLHGDWALALWSEADRTLYLARDHAGIRTLHFWEARGAVLWSTYLDTFFGESPTFTLSLEFARAYLSGARTHDLTPYDRVRSVPPAHYVRFSGGQRSCVAHWSPLVEQEAGYASDEQYEERFRDLFFQAVRRRTTHRAHPVIAELSGGMDSSSIVCVADLVASSQRQPSHGCIETLSYYDDAEPNWNERPYFSAVEAQRQHTGIHVELSFAERGFELVPEDSGIYLWPGATRSVAERQARVAQMLKRGGFRSVLSGIGGDELLGGVPYAVPELADYLASGRLSMLLSQAVRWCLADRSSLLWMLRDLFTFTASAYRGKETHRRKVPPWVSMPPQTSISDDFCSTLRERLGSRPSALANYSTWRSILETLPSKAPPPSTRYEYLYPYLDRDLVEFLLAVPREQLVRPGRRRSLMRRALHGIVPVEILERRRKAYAIRGPLRSLQQASGTLERLLQDSHLAEMGLIDPYELSRCMTGIVNGTTTEWWPSLVSTVLFELWFRALTKHFPCRDLPFHFSRRENVFSSLAPVGDGLSERRKFKERRYEP